MGRRVDYHSKHHEYVSCVPRRCASILCKLLFSNGCVHFTATSCSKIGCVPKLDHHMRVLYTSCLCIKHITASGDQPHLTQCTALLHCIRVCSAASLYVMTKLAVMSSSSRFTPTNDFPNTKNVQEEQAAYRFKRRTLFVCSPHH